MMMVNKITAEEARVTSEQHMKMVRLFDMIRHMSAMGLYYIISELTGKEVVFFEDLGYNLSKIQNASDIKISWESLDEV